MMLVPDVATLDTELEKATKLFQTILEIENASKALNFLTIKDVADATGWSLGTVRQLFNRPDFPSCDFGKEKIVEIHAALNYFSVPRRKEE